MAHVDEEFLQGWQWHNQQQHQHQSNQLAVAVGNSHDFAFGGIRAPPSRVSSVLNITGKDAIKHVIKHSVIYNI